MTLTEQKKKPSLMISSITVDSALFSFLTARRNGSVYSLVSLEKTNYTYMLVFMM
jgi:hypothetical protein